MTLVSLWNKFKKQTNNFIISIMSISELLKLNPVYQSYDKSSYMIVKPQTSFGNLIFAVRVKCSKQTINISNTAYVNDSKG